jgi:hypothetical protein
VGRGKRERKQMCEESRVERAISKREKQRLKLSSLRKNWVISSFWAQEVVRRVFITR